MWGGILNSLNIFCLREENYFGIIKCNYMYFFFVILFGWIKLVKKVEFVWFLSIVFG